MNGNLKEFSEASQAKEAGYAGCGKCGQVVYLGGKTAKTCPRCLEKVTYRVPHSMRRSLALLVAAIGMFIPANILPVMTTVMFGKEETGTILGGIIILFDEGSIGIAAIVFIASILIPLLKLIGLVILLGTVHFRRNANLSEKMFLYRLVELIGRWSMLDIFVITVLVTLADMGRIASAIPRIGASAFCLLVILTMVSAGLFDTRLIWDMNREYMNKVMKKSNDYSPDKRKQDC